MSKILIVDDEQLFLETLVEGLKSRREMEGIEVMTATNGKAAMEILQSNPDMDLVLTDLRMPEMDGLQLISYMIKKHPLIPIIVMTAYGSKEIEKTVKEKGILYYIEKPIDFDELIQKVSSRLSAKHRGTLKGFKLSTLLQIMTMDKLSCKLSVTKNGKTGILYLKEGQVINARLGNLEAEEAAMEIVAWEGGEIDIDEPENDVDKAISMSLMNLLLEALRKKDEKNLSEKGKDFFAGKTGKESKKELIKEKPKKKEVNKMKKEKLDQAIEVLKEDLGNGLVSTNIWPAKDGTTIAGWNDQPAASALFAQMTKMMNKALADAGFPALDQYYLVHLKENKLVLIINLKEYQWGILMDSEKVPLGMLLSVAMPKAIKAFEEALKA